MTIAVPLLAAVLLVVGLLFYFNRSNPKLHQLGLVMIGVALLALTFMFVRPLVLHT